MIDEKDQLINNLENEVRRLRDENKKLEETVQWMHDTIGRWSRKRRTKGWGYLQPDSRKACGDPCIIKRPSGTVPEVSFTYAIGFQKCGTPLSPSVSIKNGIPGSPSS